MAAQYFLSPHVNTFQGRTSVSRWCATVFAPTVLALGMNVSGAAVGDLALHVIADNAELVIQTCARFAGAVCSIRFRGKEHIDTKDHGRLLQSASSFNGYGECYNPTEGGAQRDRENSTSLLKEARVEGNRLRTLSEMAFWLRPAQRYSRGCGRRPEFTEAMNSTLLSGHLLEKQITVGLPGFPNVIEHRVTYHVPDRFSHAVFEASTGYMPEEFSLHMYFNPVTGMEIDPGSRQGEQALPVILATPDRRFAMGVYSPALPQNRLGYGRFTFPGVVKWNCVFRENIVTPGPYTYRCLIVIGSVSEVQETLRRLAATGLPASAKRD